MSICRIGNPLVIAALALAACTSSPTSSPSDSVAAESSAPAETPSPTDTSTPTASDSPSPIGGPGQTVTVTITGRSFGPNLTILAGTAVVFTNDAGVPHTVTNGTGGVANPDARFDEAVAEGGSSDAIVFDTPGTYDVTCKIHRSMHMTITVV